MESNVTLPDHIMLSSRIANALYAFGLIDNEDSAQLLFDVLADGLKQAGQKEIALLIKGVCTDVEARRRELCEELGSTESDSSGAT